MTLLSAYFDIVGVVRVQHDSSGSHHVLIGPVNHATLASKITFGSWTIDELLLTEEYMFSVFHCVLAFESVRLEEKIAWYQLYFEGLLI